MSQTENKSLYSGRRIVKNTVYNFIGLGLPLVFAVVLIPFLIKGFGEEKFGILNLAWIVIGYFSLFDFGIGRALTKFVAERIGLDRRDDIPSIFWTSLFLMLTISMAGAIAFYFVTPYLVTRVLNISPGLQTETIDSFYLLAISIPIVATSAGLRGVLEAYQKFVSVNVIRIFLGIFTFVGPMLTLFFTNSLYWVVMVLLIIRFLTWCLYLGHCLHINKDLKNHIRFDTADIKPVLKMSGWIMVTNILAPVIVYIDRFMIGSVISTTAITFYATPFEVVNRLTLIPTAVVGVLFPVFSASYISNPGYSKKLFITGIKFIIISMFPILFLLITFAGEGMQIWLGPRFAENSSLVLQLLAIGILFNSIAYFPYNFLQGTGKANLPGILHLIELPIYLILMWVGIHFAGIIGVAAVWMFRMMVDSGMLLLFSNQSLKFELKPKHILMFFVLIACSVLPVFIFGIVLKTVFAVIVLAVFGYLSWTHLLSPEDKKYFNIEFLRTGLVKT